VSIKPAQFTGKGGIRIGTQIGPDTVALTGIKLRDLIARAYSLQPYQIVGRDSLDEEYYDILARSANPVPESERRLMLQSMLASRFQLTAHTEKKELSCYELVVARDGLKLRALVADDTGPRLYPGAGGIRASAISIQRLAELLTLRTDRPVLDKTGVSGVFDIDLKWAADPATEPGPSLFTAVQHRSARASSSSR
jgi:uncharacterized protein (TIGR03435 family)